MKNAAQKRHFPMSFMNYGRMPPLPYCVAVTVLEVLPQVSV